MKIKEFGVEQWMNDYEDDAQFNLGETCVSPLSLHDLLMVTHVDEPKFMHELLHKRLTYGDIFGNVELKQNIARLYQTALKPDQIVTTHGAIGANNLVLNSLVAPDDEVVVVAPTYQQMQSIPEALGATVKLLQLTAEHNYLPDINELRQLVSSKTKLIILNNPNNPSGALMSEEVLRDIVAVAQKVDAYVMCDEVYRHLTQDDRYSPSIVDLYEHGIATSSMSKVFSLAGLRLGWIVTRDAEVMATIHSHRDYDTISSGVLNEMIANVALSHAEIIIERNRKIIRQNLVVLEEWVKTQPHISWVKPAAGTTALLHYDFTTNSEPFCDQLYQQKGVLLVPGAEFDIEHAVRIGYAFETAQLRNGLAEVAAFISENQASL